MVNCVYIRKKSNTYILQRPSDHQENDGDYVVFWAQVPFCKLNPKNYCTFFSRGAIAYALSLHLEFDEEVGSLLSVKSQNFNSSLQGEKSTGDYHLNCCPLHHHCPGWGYSSSCEIPGMQQLENSSLNILCAFQESRSGPRNRRRRRKKDITLSKTKEFGALDSEHLSGIACFNKLTLLTLQLCRAD